MTVTCENRSFNQSSGMQILQGDNIVSQCQWNKTTLKLICISAEGLFFICGFIRVLWDIFFVALFFLITSNLSFYLSLSLSHQPLYCFQSSKIKIKYDLTLDYFRVDQRNSENHKTRPKDQVQLWNGWSICPNQLYYCIKRNKTPWVDTYLYSLLII